jgi:hypothetical protein
MLDFDGIVLASLQGTFSRPITVMPYASKPGSSPYNGRGVYSTSPIDFIPETNLVLSDQKTQLWVRRSEYPVMPIAGDQIHIPAHMNYPAEGLFEIVDNDSFADGKVIITLKKLLRQ